MDAPVKENLAHVLSKGSEHHPFRSVIGEVAKDKSFEEASMDRLFLLFPQI